MKSSRQYEEYKHYLHISKFNTVTSRAGTRNSCCVAFTVRNCSRNSKDSPFIASWIPERANLLVWMSKRDGSLDGVHLIGTQAQEVAVTPIL
jgi:hypothetical protein